ncbi:MAG: 16S rRNA (guanine(966)-N(2))-methyltransferase RsmD [Candidatus Kapabacteria bacterium]|nr:16S rRNA (guanine(966)-N(2))-methyltransferase RsmD [Ignavibacteriota bacterium]MCW5886233.1 16S rRNA (guanine(966)-N(2))-methyltransferase RsmD [Candidatus Kapabacteria bacterium]
MRIIGGKYKSRRINLKIPPNVRPTADKNRESMFNVLNNYVDFTDLKIIDLYAGSGALGFEALSRGAGFVSFVDNSRKSLELIKSAAKQLEIDKINFEIVQQDALKYLRSKSSNKYDILFADPPYDNCDYNDLFQTIIETDILDNVFIAVIEYRTVNDIEIPTQFNILSQKKFGDTSFLVIEKKI